MSAACGSDDKGSDSASASASAPSKGGFPAITAGAKFGEKPTLAKGTGTPPKELKTKVISEGDGAKLKNGDVTQVNYLGQAYDSTKPFDNSFDRKQPFDLTLGSRHGHPGLGGRAWSARRSAAGSSSSSRRTSGTAPRARGTSSPTPPWSSSSTS